MRKKLGSVDHFHPEIVSMDPMNERNVELRETEYSCGVCDENFKDK